MDYFFKTRREAEGVIVRYLICFVIVEVVVLVLVAVVVG